MTSGRDTDHAIDAIFTDRFSPRSFTSDIIPDQDLFSMFEAARWAPSSSNVQPWRFIYAKRDTPEWAPILDGLMPFNQAWAKNAAALVVFISDINMVRGGEKIVSTSHAFDTGAAWLSFALQAHALGYVTHAMGGFFSDKLRASLNVPENFTIHAVVAVGKQGPADTLPDDLKPRELPSPRRKLADSLFHGRFMGA